MRWFLGAVLLIILLLFGAMLAFNAGLFQDKLEQEISAITGASVRLGPVRILYRWPLAIRVGESEILRQDAQLNFRTLEIQIQRIFRPYFFAIKFVDPYVRVADQAPKVSEVSKPSPVGEASSSTKVQPLPFGVRIDVINGQVSGMGGTLSHLNLTFAQKGLFHPIMASLHAQGSFSLPVVPFEIPARIDTDTLTLTPETLKAKAIQASVASIQADIQGASLLKDERHRWIVDLRADDLSQLKGVPQDWPVTKASGQVVAHIEVLKQGKGSVQIQGMLKMNDVRADLNWRGSGEKAGYEVVGPLAISSSIQFASEGEKWSIGELKMKTQLTSARVNFKDFLNKESGIPLDLDVDGLGNSNEVTLNRAHLNLWQIHLNLSGKINSIAPWQSDLKFLLEPTSLSGADQVFPLAKGYPVAGSLSVQGMIKGPLLTWQDCDIHLEKAELKKFSANVKFEKEGMVQIRGPVAGDLSFQGDWQSRKVNRGEGQINLNLKQAAATIGPLRKEAGSDFLLLGALKTLGDGIQIDYLTLDSWLGRLRFTGRLDQQKAPLVIDGHLTGKGLNLTEWRIALPGFRELIPKGQVGFDLNASGPMDFSKKWFEWPLMVQGTVEADLPEYEMKEEDPRKVNRPSQAQTPVSEAPNGASSLLPKGALSSNLKLKSNVRVNLFKKGGLVAKQVSVTGDLVQGQLTARATLGELFGGQWQFNNLKIPMFDTKPRIEGRGTWSRVVIEDMVQFAKPEVRDFATGRFDGQIQFFNLPPGGPDVLYEMRAKGDLVAKPVTLNSVKVGEMVNEVVKKIPGGQVKPMKVTPLNGELKTPFEIDKGVLTLNQFLAKDVDGSEVHLKGRLGLRDFFGDFAGTFFWVTSQVKGCLFEGNRDELGRMVVPISVKGNLMQPSFSLVGDMLTQLAGRALECEKKKFVDKLKGDGKEKLEQGLKNALDGLLGK